MSGRDLGVRDGGRRAASTARSIHRARSEPPRAACIGAKGAGKSTMIKLLTGELQPDQGSGDVWKHPNARVAYVAQHAFHHIEQHLDKSPNEYIRWRYEGGDDKEALCKATTRPSRLRKCECSRPLADKV